ncbi:hypothetical protein OZK63_27350 [Streptomyces sp. UMAF16]|nr:hypothetical protein [Streptomyces sp. UMAF16]
MPPLFSVVPEALAAPYADVLGSGSAGLGLLMCALPVGTARSRTGARLRPPARERAVLPLLCLTLLPYLGFALRPGLTGSLLLLLLSGLDQWFVRAVPEEPRGRAMTGLMTVQGAGMAPAGPAAQAVGVRAAVTGAGALGTLCCRALALRARAERPVTESRDRADRHMTGR